MPAFLLPMLGKIGLKGGAIIALCLALGIMWWRADVWQGRAERSAQTLAEMKAAQGLALKAAQAAKERAEREYEELAERIDDDAEKARESAMDAAERFIAANRVRCAPDRGAGSGAVAPAPDRGTGGGESPGQAPELDGTLVAVKPDDVRICTVNTLQAEAAREWALGLEAATP